MPEKEDQILVSKLKRGNRLAFNALYKSYFSDLYSFTVKLTNNLTDAEEIVQEVFIKLWETKHTLDKNKNFKSLLFTIAKNMIYNRARKRVYEYAYINYLQQQISNDESTIDREMAYLETKSLIEKGIDQLPSRRKEIFILSRREGLSNKEIANKLKTSTSNIENHINKALKSLKKYMVNHEIIVWSLPFIAELVIS